MKSKKTLKAEQDTRSMLCTSLNEPVLDALLSMVRDGASARGLSVPHAACGPIFYFNQHPAVLGAVHN